MKLFLIKADEVEGEHTRLIEFLVCARNVQDAQIKARGLLRGEWLVEPDRLDQHDVESGMVAQFFDGEIVIENLTVEPITPRRAIRQFTRGEV